MSEATTQQQQPRPGGRPVVPDLVRLLLERRDFGARKYGVELHTANGRDPYIDALQELLDLVIYLHQAQMETAELRAENEQLRKDLESMTFSRDRAQEAGQATAEALVEAHTQLDVLRNVGAAAQERVDFLLAAASGEPAALRAALAAPDEGRGLSLTLDDDGFWLEVRDVLKSAAIPLNVSTSGIAYEVLLANARDLRAASQKPCPHGVSALVNCHRCHLAAPASPDPEPGPSERFERLAEEFRRETGLLAPGKDAPPMLYTEEQDEERQRLWVHWLRKRRLAASPDPEGTRAHDGDCLGGDACICPPAAPPSPAPAHEPGCAVFSPSGAPCTCLHLQPAPSPAPEPAHPMLDPRNPFVSLRGAAEAAAKMQPPVCPHCNGTKRMYDNEPWPPCAACGGTGRAPAPSTAKEDKP